MGLRHQEAVDTMQKLTKAICLFCLGLFAAEATAAYQSHDSIQDAVRQFMMEHTRSVYQQTAEIRNGRLDSRLRLNQCSLPLEVYIPEGSRDLGRITVGVRCADAKPWSLHVPTTVTIYKDIVVTAKSLSRGTILSPSDLKRVRHDVSKLPDGYIEDENAGIGMELKRRLSGGEALTTGMIRKPKIVKRGQQVSIVAGTGGMEVRMSGKALAHGAAGDRIRVLNLKSKRKIEGTVTPSGDIRVDI